MVARGVILKRHREGHLFSRGMRSMPWAEKRRLRFRKIICRRFSAAFGKVPRNQACQKPAILYLRIFPHWLYHQSMLRLLYDFLTGVKKNTKQVGSLHSPQLVFGRCFKILVDLGFSGVLSLGTICSILSHVSLISLRIHSTIFNACSLSFTPLTVIRSGWTEIRRP